MCRRLGIFFALMSGWEVGFLQANLKNAVQDISLWMSGTGVQNQGRVVPSLREE